MRALLTAILILLASPVMAQPSGCPYDGDGDGRVDIEDLYHLTQNPADINGDGIADSDDTRCLEAYLRCIERLDMSFRPGEPAADGNVPSLSYRASGTSQVMRVVREPSPEGLGCISQAWTTTLLGTRAGLTGPVEIRLDRDGFLWQSLFTDAATASPGSTARRGMLTCDGSGVEFVASSPAMTVRSSSETRALVLLHGQNIIDAAVAKGVEDAAARSIGGGLIDAYTDTNGDVTLPTRGVLVLFELDAGDQSNPSFAFDDAVLLVDLECGDVSDDSPQVFVLRDSIGPDAMMTDSNAEIWNFIDISPGGNIGFVLFPITGGESGVEIVSVDMVLSQISPFSIEWADTQFGIKVWSSLAAAAQNNISGDVANHQVYLSTSPPPPLQGSLDGSALGTFDLTAAGIMVPASTTYWCAIPQTNGMLPDPGFVGTKESVESGTSDWGFFGFGPPLELVDQAAGSSFDGRAAIRIFARPLP